MAVSKLPSFNSLDSFYKNKSILNSYKFQVGLIFDKYVANNVIYLAANPLRFLPRIEPYHILSVDVPMNSFTRESTAIGALQYSYPVLSKEQPLDIKITFEEDQSGTIAGFIQEMQESVIRGGYHVPPAKSRLGDIHILLDTQVGTTASWFTAKDVFFLGAQTITPTYDSNDSVKYDITFGTDYIQYDDTETVLLDQARRGAFTARSFR